MQLDKQQQLINQDPKHRRDENLRYVVENPVFVEMPDYVRKIRNNLILISVIGLAVEVGGLGVVTGNERAATFAGVSLTGLTDYKISVALFLVTLYQAIHFIWCSIDGWREWRIRCSGIALAFVQSKKSTSPMPPYKSLMLWLTGQVDRAEILSAEVEVLQKKLDSIAMLDDEARAAVSRHVSGADYVQPLTELMVKKFELARSGLSFAADGTLHDAINAYEQFHLRFLNSQNKRWLLFEFLMPVGLAALALILLAQDILYFWLSTI